MVTHICVTRPQWVMVPNICWKEARIQDAQRKTEDTIWYSLCRHWLHTQNTSANGWQTTTWSLYFREMIKNTIPIYILIYGRNVCWIWWEYLMLITRSSVSYVEIFRNGDNILTFQVPVPFISTYGTQTWSQAWWRHPMETFSALLTLCNRWIPITTASDAELWCPLWSAPEQTVVQTIETPVIWDVIALIVTSL